MEIPRYLSPVSLIPGGCPQFLDFELPLSALRGVRRNFREERKLEQDNGRYTHYLRCLQDTQDGFIDMLTGEPADNDYDMAAERVIEIWQAHWLPVPFLRTLDQHWPDGGKRFEYGPSNWARARVLPSSSDPSRLRVILLFDTNVEDRPSTGEQYHALSPQDVAAHGHFMLAHHVRDNAWFLNAAWVDEWLSGIYDAYRQGKHSGRGSWRDDDPYLLQHLAAYLTWLDVVRRAIGDVSVQTINPSRDTPMDVDLVLDIGNSRTTGILIETPPQSHTNLNNSYLLQLRDLSRPDLVYEEPFETRVEFVDATFGNDALSRRSGRRTPAFAWPSSVRLGPEAARLTTRAVCAEGCTGMSSPKRYLWDERPWQQSWRYNTGGNAEPMVSRGLFPRQLNPQGTPLACFDDPLFKKSPALRKQQAEPLFESLFTRSSLMMFMLGEILTQAIITINSPATRARRELPNLPRRLRRVIFTVPTAMPVAEKRIFRRWVLWAVRVVWEALGWSAWHTENGKRTIRDYRASPVIRCDWDEASCSQLVLLYNELGVKHHGDAHHLFQILGKPRAAYDNRPCVRVASLDIGGGTTDLSITTYELASAPGETARIVPHTEFRDGFNRAGDEVLRAVVARHIIPAVEQELQKRGVDDPSGLIARYFGRDAIGTSQRERNTRVRLVRQIAAPVALGILTLCEEGEAASGRTCRIRDFFLPAQDDAPQDTPMPFRAPHPQKETLAAINELARRMYPSIDDFSIMDVALDIVPEAVDKTILDTLGDALSSLCELVRLYDSDALILTGRPSAWNAVIDGILAKVPVPPDRIIPMRHYHVGAWYPFTDAVGRITDPKTTVVVGAILCALAEGHLEGFSFDTRALRLSSTARYIGEMDINGQLRRPHVWFEVNVDNKEGVELSRDVAFSGPLFIGYRQLEAERWPTTRYHLLDFTSEEARSRASGHLPYTVSLRLRVADVWDDNDSRGSEDKDRNEGDFIIDTVSDRNGRSVQRQDLEIRLQTLPLDEGYWLDTGVVVTGG